MTTVRGRGRRRWRWVVLAAVTMIAGVFASLPWLLDTGPAQRQLAAAANKILAPGSVTFSAVRLSWFRPTEIANFVLHDAQGDPLIAAPRATFSWSLWQCLINRPTSATLRFDESDVDIERFADGTVDLYETLKPVISEHPPVKILIQIEDGRLRFRDPAFTDPVVAEKANIALDLGRHSEPITWNIQLIQTPANGPTGRVAIKGTYSRANVGPADQHDLTLALEGTRWPWTLANSQVQARGELTGKLDGQIRTGRVIIDADASFANVVAIGDALASDTVHLESARARLALEGNDGSWTIGKLELSSPVVAIEGQGTIPPRPDRGAWLEAKVDLAAVARQLPATLHLRDDLRVEHGDARLRADIRSASDGHTEEWNVSGKVAGLAARLGEKKLTLPEPATLVARLQRQGTATKLEKFDVQTSFLTATGEGDLDRGIAVAATLDLAAFHERFRDWIDLGEVELAGKGKLAATYRRIGDRYATGVDAAFRDLRLGGLPVVATIQRDQLTFDATLGGEATSSGWPRSWRELTVHGSSGETDVRLSAHAGASPDGLLITGRATTPLSIADQRYRLDGELSAKSATGEWIADRIALGLVRPSKWGPGIAPDQAIRWEGTGRYDPGRDQLVVTSLASLPRPPNEHESWITGNQQLRVAGLKSLETAQVDLAANADLSSLGRWLAPGERPWGGQVDAALHARRDQELWNLGMRLEIRDPERTTSDGSKIGLPGPTILTATAGYAPRPDRLQLTELTLTAPYLRADGAGQIHELTGRPRVDLKGSLNPDWGAIQSLLAQKVEPNARIAGRPHPWRLTGTPDGVPAIDRMGSLEGEMGVQIDSLDVFGMRLSAVPVVLRSAGGHLTIDPIDSRLNSGTLHLEPELLRDKNNSTWLHLGRDSRLDGAVVNDEVSHRVLSFAAPVLDGATRVEGRVSLALADAYFPILASSDAQARIEGDVLFDDVRFMPGPLADQLLSVFQRERRPLAVLTDPVNVRIAGRKVYQEGLVVPVGNLASIGVNGSVDFDQNLDLVARFALTPSGPNVPVLTPIMQIAKFDLPIRGTLKNPKIDAEALKEHWKGVGVDLLGDSMQVGVDGLQRLLQGLPIPGLRGLIRPGRRAAPPVPPPPDPADPADANPPGELAVPRIDREALKPSADASQRPAPLTAAERKKIRQERRQEKLQKKADRRANREPN